VLQSTYAHPDALFRAQLEFWRWLVEVAPSERAFFEAFFTWVYTPRAHADGSLSQIIEETLAFTYQQSVDAFQAQVDALMGHDTTDRLSEIAVRTLVIAGEFDIIFPARFGRLVASSPRRLVASSPRPRKHPRAEFDLLPGEAHQPFQEVPETWNERVDAFWRSVEKST
jgi:pimeloyl-ACP methyl ester carboxylesterase